MDHYAMVVIVRVFWLLFFALMHTPRLCWALDVGPDHTVTQLNGALSYFKDIDNSLTVQGAVALPESAWSRVTKAGFGQSTARYWFYVDLRNISAQALPLVLEISHPTLDSVNLYLKGAQGHFREIRNGNLATPGDGKIPHLAPAFLFEIAAHEKMRLYFSVQSLRSSLFVPVALHSPKAFRSKANRDHVLAGALIGLTVILIFYAIMLLIGTRQIIFAYFLTLVIFFTWSQLAMTGVGSLFLWPADGWLNRTSLFYVRIIYMVGLILFTVEYLDLRNQNAVFRKTLHAMCATLLLFFVAYTVAPETMYPQLLRAQNLIQFLMLGALFIFSLILALKGIQASFSYLLVWGVFLAGAMGRTLMIQGILPHNEFLVSIFFVAPAIGITILSLALANQLNRLQREKVHAQNESIINQQRAIDSQAQMTRVKDEFLARTSHELRTPLQGIIGLTENLLTHVTNVSARKDAGLILQSARRLSYLINDILDYSYMKERDLILNHVDLDLGVQVDKVLRSLEFVSQNKGVPILNRIAPRNLLVRADEQRLQQILFNIIGNALKFTSTGSVMNDAKAETDMVAVSISDTGPGIATEQITEIFQRFGRIDGEQTSGTGLGLNITKSLVELHGGKIRVESKVGSGSTFTITLPVGKASTNSQALPTPLPERSLPTPKTTDNQQYVLIIEDDPFILHSTAEHLRRRGFEVATAPDGASARLQLQESFPPMLVILDLMLPDVSGIVLCREFREKHPAKTLPILMLTARSEFKDFLSAANAGANDFLAKPFEISNLFMRIDNLLTLATLRRDIETTESEYLRRVYEDMHDHLGSVLTDISIMAGNLRGDEQIDATALRELQIQSTYALKVLRERLQAIADQAELTRDFFGCLNAQLLRRYTGAGRTLSFHVDEKIDQYISRDENMLVRRDIYLITSEIVTNDLKYGNEHAHWSWQYEPGVMRIQIITRSEYNPTKQKTGLGTASISSRVAALDGSINYVLREGRLQIYMEFPILS